MNAQGNGASNNGNGSESRLRIVQVFTEAQQLHQALRFADAERGYRMVLEQDPTQLIAWHHLGLACMAQNKLGEAGEAFHRVLETSPDDVDTLTQMALVLARQSRLPDAIAMFRRVIELKPDHAQAHNNLGVAFAQLGRRDEALACHAEAAKLKPDYAEAHFNVAVCLADRKQFPGAIDYYKRALRIRPDHPDALFNLGMLLLEDRRAGEAVILLEQAARLLPNNPEAHNNLSLALADIGRFEEALQSCEASLRLNPRDAKSHMNRGNVLATLGRIDEAIAAYDYSQYLQPEYPNAYWNRALSYLSLGDFERGWADYEWRWHKPDSRTRSFPEPRWDGSSLKDKTILLWCEQGLGDTLQFVRYAEELKKRGATVWVECPESLAGLLANCRGVDRVIVEGPPLPPGFDCHAPFMSLPFLCGTTLATVPAEVPYLSTDSAAVDRWREEFRNSPVLKIGITWQGNPMHRYDRHRSFSIQWFRALSQIDGVTLFSLQKGKGSEQLPSARFPITDLTPKLDERGGDFKSTAEAMQALDLVITCDSSVTHLAGALGLPVWLPLSLLSDWRWLRDREDNPWYPTMRIFRQAKLGEWGPVFERIRSEVMTLRDEKRKDNRPATKVLALAAALDMRAKARKAGTTVVWTNGCFDLIHVGHIQSLQAAKRFGDILIVGVNSDASVARLKGAGRPIVPVAERIEHLAALSCVDHVVVFDEDTPVEAITRLQPDVHCKGVDYAPPNGKPIPEAAIVEGYGGQIKFLPLVSGVSTSNLIERIRDANKTQAEEA